MKRESVYVVEFNQLIDELDNDWFNSVEGIFSTLEKAEKFLVEHKNHKFIIEVDEDGMKEYICDEGSTYISASVTEYFIDY